jgi:hypothetical protein
MIEWRMEKTSQSNPAIRNAASNSRKRFPIPKGSSAMEKQIQTPAIQSNPKYARKAGN